MSSPLLMFDLPDGGDHIVPQLFMMAVYGFILFRASETISAGSEMLLAIYGPGTAHRPRNAPPARPAISLGLIHPPRCGSTAPPAAFGPRAGAMTAAELSLGGVD